jgi:hypothetical protein
MATQYATIVVRRGNAESWADSARPLEPGEWGYDETSRVTKIGDGFSLWAELPIFMTATATGDLPTQVRSQLAANLGDPGTLEGAAIAEAVAAGGGSAPADPGYDIVILAGQSNMSGRGTPFSATTDPINARIFQYGNSGAAKNTISPASEPLLMHDTPSGIGPGLQFARWYTARRLALGRKVLLVPVAHGGTALSTTAALGWRRGVAGNLYANMIAQVQGALSAAGSGSRIVAALWLQGETDGDAGTTGAQYQTDLDALIAGLRTDLSESTLPFIIGTMVPEYLSTGTRAQIDAVHRDTPNRIARTDVAVSAVSMNKGDGNHFNGPGSRYNGRAFFDAFERVSAGLAPYSEVLPTLGQVTGLAGGTPTGNSVPLSWNAVTGATAYLVEYQVNGASSWTSVPRVTDSAATVTGLTASTTYRFRVSAQTSTASGPVSTVLTISTAENVIINVLGVASSAQAYSLRKVGDNYAGKAVNVRRATDNATTDIGFVAGALDTNSLLSFAGSGDAFIVTWYDQSGNSRHITQSVAAKQPKLVSSGAVITSAGKPAAQFDGTDDILSNMSPALFVAGSATACGVVSAAVPGGQKRMWAESASTVGTQQYGLQQPDIGSAAAMPVMTTAFPSTDTTKRGTLATFNGAAHQLSAVDTGSTLSQWLDGAIDLNAAAYTRPSEVKDRFAIGGVVRSGSEANFAMLLSEFAFWPTALGSTDRQSVAASQKAFYGTP